MTPKHPARLLGLLATAAVLSAPAIAQNTNGSISGTVKDASGAVVPGAVITITNEDTGVSRTFKSSGSGVYTATTLAFGNYTVKIEAPGFTTQVVNHLTLHAYDALTVNGDLKAGSSNQEVSVTADQLQLNSENATVSGLLNGTQVKELILNNRNYEQLLALQPGVVYGGTTDQLYIGSSLPGGTTATVAFSVSGNRSSTNNWTIDGTTNVDRGSNLTLLSYPSIDAIQEIKTLRNTYTAEYGGSVGGQVNVVIRSGTNSLHGTVYEFFRNDVLNANNYFNKLTATPTARPLLRYNDFGGTVGGPIWKDHTFFFFSGEYRRVINYASISQNGVPTALERQGIFNVNVCTRETFTATTATCATTGNRVTAIDPTAAAYVRDIFAPDGSRVLLPNAPALGPNYVVSNQRAVYNENQEVARIDHNFGQRLVLSGRMIYDEIPTLEPGGAFTNASSLPGVNSTVNQSSTNSPGHNYLGRATYTVSPTLVVEGGYDYSYGAILSTPNGYLSNAVSTDIKPILPFASTLGIVPIVTMTGATSLTSSGIYNVRSVDHNVFAQATKTIGRHTLIFGATYHNYLKTENATGSNAGSFAFTNTNAPAGTTAQSFQQSFANFLSGYAASYTQASTAITPKLKSNLTEAFLQDNWKVSSRFTANFGVRYSYFGNPVDQNNLLDNFSPANYNAALAPTIDTNGNICLKAPCVGGAAPNANYDPLNGIILGDSYNTNGYATARNHQSPYGATVSPNKWANVAPRLGFAYDLGGDGKTVLRGGYGIAFDSTLFGTYEQSTFQNPPYVQTVTYNNVQFNNPTGGNVATTFAPNALRATDPNFRTPYTQQFSLGFQREILPDLVLTTDYVGNHGVHLQGVVDINEVAPGAYTQAPLNLSPLNAAGTGQRFTSSSSELVLNRIRPYLGYNAINVVQTVFGSNYNSLQVQVQKRFKGANLVDVNYTYSKALTDNQTDRSTSIQDRTNPRAEYGPSQYDRRHVFTADFVYELPFFREQHGFLGHVAGGWQFSGIVAVNSGLPFTASTSNLDPGGLGFLGASASGGRPDQVGNPNKNAPHTRLQWFNTAAFAPVPLGQARPGNARRGSILGPGFQRWDLGFMRNFKLTEKHRTDLQFRAESFNTFNHTNWATIATSAFVSQTGFGTSYGQVTATRDPRILQLALKLNY
ncbi:TonB-dependent receptor [Terriglobus aquaticus]|uniref:Carboxypeptidase regulatory-like domain-containing protein n=1 Tax=Terriglobus aquaticus TaxID=940139 RepID=A0ABW9KPR6_9BACT|nr:TonB-dependent receptor [Terriglobus aquaticus]